MRVFAALPMPAETASQIAPITARFQQYRGLKTVADYHVTLHFFGEQSAEQVASIAAAMDACGQRPPIRARLGQLGQFPERGNPRVIFVGFSQGAEEVAGVQSAYVRRIAEIGAVAGAEAVAIAQAGLTVEREKRPFLPHVTLARNKHARLPRDFLSEFDALEQDFVFDRLVLFESVLKPSGAEYHALKTVMFTPEYG